MLDKIEFDVKRNEGVYELEVEIECSDIAHVFGEFRWREFDDVLLRKQFVDDLGGYLRRHNIVSAMLLEEKLSKRVAYILGRAITSEPYLLSTMVFTPVEKVGPRHLYPPDGMFLDVAASLEDTIHFTYDGRNIRFIIHKDTLATPWRLIVSAGADKDADAMKISEFGYLPAEQGPRGIYVPKVSCPYPKASPKLTQDSAYCMVQASMGKDAPFAECPGFGGFADGMTVCRYAKKMEAEMDDDDNEDYDDYDE